MLLSISLLSPDPTPMSMAYSFSAPHFYLALLLGINQLATTIVNNFGLGHSRVLIFYRVFDLNSFRWKLVNALTPRVG